MTVPGNELLFLALGGSDEIGMNLNLYGCEGKWVMVDLGVTFGNADYPGIDVILPDIEFIEQQKENLLGIVLTHAHEDHIGAVPYLAHDLGVPLYANRFTAAMIRGKLAEEGLEDKVKLHVIDMDGEFDLGPFHFRFVQLAHSIPDMSACIIETPYGKVFHTGDWKFDDHMGIGQQAPADRLRAIGDEDILALVCDSTNVFNAEAAGSEGGVKAGLLETVRKAPARVLVTTFASNAARLKTLGEVARETGRQLCVAGRSLDRIIAVSQANGYLKDFPPLVDFDTAMRLPRDKVMIIATGGQGEPRAALARIAGDVHQIKLDAGDWCLFSSRQIPGNELAIGRIQNQLALKGVVMVTERQAHIHVSGHPGRPELALMYEYIRPRIVMPVHGEVRHMQEQCRFALSHGVQQAMFQRNGQVVRLAPGDPKVIDHVRSGRLVLDGDVILPADGETINQRRKLALNGHISVAVAIDGAERPVGSARVRYQGVPVEHERDDFIDDMVHAAGMAAGEPARDIDKRRENIRLAVRRVATEWTGKKPIVDVLILEV